MLRSVGGMGSIRREVDGQGLEVTLSPHLSAEEAREVVQSIDEFSRQVLRWATPLLRLLVGWPSFIYICSIGLLVRCCFRYGQDWHVIERAVEIDPSCVLAMVLAADYEIAK